VPACRAVKASQCAPPPASREMGFFATYAWFTMLLGGGLLMWTLALLVLSGCGKRLTHWNPIIFGLIFGGFMAASGLNMCRKTDGCMPMTTPT
jgi:hypothetical protein